MGPFLVKEKEQAEVGQTLLYAFEASFWGTLGILREFFDWLKSQLKAKKDTLNEFVLTTNKVMEKLNAIKYGKVTGDKLSKISLALGRSKRLVFAQMVDYFYRNKKDPTDLNDELLKISLAKGHKSYMAFIRSQEDLLLIPIKQGVEKMIINQRDIVKFFNEQVLGANKTLLKNQQELLKTAQDNDKLIKLMAQKMESRESLKLKMLQLFNGYLKSYQELGSFRGREKEELAEQVLKNIKNL